MEANLLILGCLFILTLFSVGESVHKHFKISKGLLLLILAAFMASVFLPPLELAGATLYFDKIVLPAVICFVLMFSVKKLSRFLFSFLFCTLASIFYFLSNLEFVLLAVEPFILLGAFLGVFVGLNSAKVSESLPSIFFGINLGSVIYHVSKFESLEAYFFEGSVFSAVLVAWMVSSLVLFLKQKMYAMSAGYQREQIF